MNSKIKVNVSGLGKIQERLKKLKQSSSTDLAMAVAEYGKDYAETLYGGDVVVTAESIGDGKSRITASGKQVAFIEYGIGTKGEASGYVGELPTTPSTFINRAGKLQTVDEWTYNYFVKTFDKNADPVDGFVSRAYMWRTSENLRQGGIKTAIGEYLDEKGD